MKKNALEMKYNHDHLEEAYHYYKDIIFQVDSVRENTDLNLCSPW